MSVKSADLSVESIIDSSSEVLVRADKKKKKKVQTSPQTQPKEPANNLSQAANEADRNETILELSRFMSILKFLITELPAQTILEQSRLNMWKALLKIAVPGDGPLVDYVDAGTRSEAESIVVELTPEFQRKPTLVTIAQRRALMRVFQAVIDKLLAVDGVRVVRITRPTAAELISKAIRKTVPLETKYSVAMLPKQRIILCVDNNEEIGAIRNRLLRTFSALKLCVTLEMVYQAEGSLLTNISR